MEWSRYSDDVVQKVGWRTITTKHFEAPDGMRHDYDTVGRPGDKTAAVIALTPSNEVVIARQYRVGPEKVFDELPGGLVDEGELPEAAARRELLEETGYGSDEELEFLGITHVDGYSNVTRYNYLLRNCRLQTTQSLDHGEQIEMQLCSIADVIENAKQARMSDCVAILQAYDELVKLDKGE